MLEQRKKFKKLWLDFSNAMDQNDTVLCNDLILKIENILPFKNEQEHLRWLNLVASFIVWEDLEDFTKNIANRL